MDWGLGEFGEEHAGRRWSMLGWVDTDDDDGDDDDDDEEDEDEDDDVS